MIQLLSNSFPTILSKVASGFAVTRSDIGLGTCPACATEGDRANSAGKHAETKRHGRMGLLLNVVKRLTNEAEQPACTEATSGAETA